MKVSKKPSDAPNDFLVMRSNIKKTEKWDWWQLPLSSHSITFYNSVTLTLMDITGLETTLKISNFSCTSVLVFAKGSCCLHAADGSKGAPDGTIFTCIVVCVCTIGKGSDPLPSRWV